MNWLFPLYLAGAAAIIAPILLHLRRQQPNKQIEFSSLMFLDPSPPVTTTRRRLHHWLLLALRCLALLLLALMFSRPLWGDSSAPATQSRAVVILLDRSASMRHADLWPRAQAKAREVLQSLKPTDQVAIATFDTSVQWLASFTDLAGRTPAERSATLQQAKPSWHSTDLGLALTQAASKALSAEKVTTRELILISDLQEGANTERLRSQAWPDQISLRLEPIRPENEDNLSLALPPTAEGQDNATHRIRVTSQRNASTENFALHWDTDTTPILTGQLSAGASRIVSVPRRDDGQPHTLHLRGDSWPFDNALHFAPTQPRTAIVLALDHSSEPHSLESPWFYLRQALQPTRDLAPEVRIIPPQPPLATLPPNTSWVLTTTDTPATQAPALKAWIESGHHAVCLATSIQSTFLTKLLSTPITLQEGAPTDFALLEDIQSTHPQLKPFADKRLTDFTKVRIWKHRTATTLPSNAEVLAKFDNGSPAWISIPIGKGSLFLMMHGWQPRESQLALSSKFVPLLFGLLQAAGVAITEPTQLHIGDPTAPSEEPGIATTADNRRIAINLATSESRIGQLDISSLQSLGVKLQSNSAAADPNERQRLLIEEQESRQQGWLWALALLLLILLTETLLAGARTNTKTPSPT